MKLKGREELREKTVLVTSSAQVPATLEPSCTAGILSVGYVMRKLPFLPKETFKRLVTFAVPRF